MNHAARSWWLPAVKAFQCAGGTQLYFHFGYLTGEVGTCVPQGTSPHLVASAIKFYLAHLRHPLLEIARLEAMAEYVGKKPAETQSAVRQILVDATNERSFLLLNVVVRHPTMKFTLHSTHTHPVHSCSVNYIAR